MVLNTDMEATTTPAPFHALDFTRPGLWAVCGADVSATPSVSHVDRSTCPACRAARS